MAFPNSLFPGVYTQLVDTSFSIASSGASTAFICVLSQKGPDNQLLSISSTDEILSKLGSIDAGKYGQGLLVLSNWFLASSNAYVVRCMPDETNLPCQNSVYKKVFGEYSLSKIKMKEAAYANIGIAVNANNKLELFETGPVYYGELKGVDLVEQPTSELAIGNKYAIAYGKNITDAEWKNYPGYIAEIQKMSGGAVSKWQYSQINSIGYAMVEETSNSETSMVEKAVAVNYVPLDEKVTKWKETTEDEIGDEYTVVKDITNVIPDAPEDGDAYLIADPTTEGEWCERDGMVATWNEILDCWQFTTPTIARIEKYYQCLYAPYTSVTIKLTLDSLSLFCKLTQAEVVDGDIIKITEAITDETFGTYPALQLFKITDKTKLTTDPNTPITPAVLKTAVEAITGLTEDDLGKKYLVGSNAAGAWKDQDGSFAYVKKVETTTLVEGVEVTTVTYEWDYMNPSVMDDGSKVLSIVVNNVSDDRLEMYKQYTETVKEITWTSDMDATFPAYIRRIAEIDSILSTSRPDLAKESGLEPLFIFYPVGRGTYYNNIQISMSLSAKSESVEDDYDKTLMLDIYDLNSGSKLLLESFEVSLNPEAEDAMNDTSLYIVNVLNNYSSILRCKAVDKMYLTSSCDYMLTAPSQLSELFAAYEMTHVVGSTTFSPSLANGTNGNLFKSDEASSVDWTIAKSILSKAYTGSIINPNAEDPNNPYLTDVLDTEMVLIDIVFDAGYPKGVKTAIFDLITARSYDCVGIVDMLDNASAEAAYNARTSSTGIGKQFNTPYIAIYEPYTEVYDKYSGLDLWVSPVFHAARAFATTDRDYGRHYAPAGINRGMCYGINKMRYNLYKESSYKDKFVTYCINPIICNRSGYVIYGQSTSYLKSSKFQDINIIRPIIQIERDLKLELANMLFEFNDEDTYAAIDTAVRSYLGNKMSEKVISNYSVKVYASDYDVTQHRCRVEIVITPKMVLYQILVTISV